MERLTYEIMDGGMVTDKENVKEFEIEDWVTVYAGNAVFRLAEYEDTGLTPPEIMELKERDTEKSVQKAEEQPYFRKHFHSYTCPVCHKKVESSWTFCGYCGQKIKREK